MKNFTSILEFHAHLQNLRASGKIIGFVPTMGYLHEGHLALIREAKKQSDVVVVSIFVNPAQFAPNEDFKKYPRDIERDSRSARDAGCDILFVPTAEEMYPNGFSTYVTVEELSSVLEGKFRPTHFKGVTTVVLKLFNLVQPHKSFFGQKDAQQCVVIKKMTRDLNVSTEISIVQTVRESDGLAMSSRNVYLTERQRSDAAVLYSALQFAKEKIESGERNAQNILQKMTTMISEKPETKIDYIEFVDAENLLPIQEIQDGMTILIPLAVRFGSTRLIDNIILRT